MIASEDINVLRKLTDALTSNGFLIDQTKEWEYAFDAMPDCVFVINLEFKMRFINKAMCERLGVKRSALLDKECFEILKCTNKECKLSYGEEETKECVEKSYDLGEFYINELGGWFKFTKSAIVDVDKKLLGFICVLRDVTERKRAEDDLREIEDRFRLLVERAPIGIFTTSSIGKPLVINLAMAQILGFHSIEKAFEHYTDLKKQLYVNPERRDEFINLISASGYVENFEYRAITGDGKIIWLTMNARISGHEDDGSFLIEGFAADITARKLAEAGLEKREAMLQSVFRTMPAGTGVISSPDRVILLVNDTLCDMLGYSKEEMEGQSARIFYKDDVEYLRVGIEKYAQVEKYGLGDVETQFKRKDGTLIDIRLRTTPIGNDDLFEGPAFNFTAADITNFKAASAKVVRDRDRLEALLKLSQVSDEDELASCALEEAIKFTQSEIGYFHFVEKDEIHLTLFKWSKKVLEGGMCTAKKTEHYPLTQAGIWADCARTRKPAVHNDYANHPYKRGLPEGHVELMRHMSVPILFDDSIVGIMGVGNKKDPYNDYDVTQVTLFAQHMVDIIQRLRAEKEKVLSEAKYKQLVEITPTGIYEIDFRLMRITYANESMLDYTGYTKEELFAISPMELLGPNSRIKFADRLKKVAQGEVISPLAEFRVIRKDGSKFWIKTTATYKFDALGLAGATVIATDITKEKLQIEALESARDEVRSANELLSAIYEFLPAVAILTTADDYVIKDVNQKFTEVTGWSKEDAIGKTTSDLHLWTNEKYRLEMRQLLESSDFTVDNIVSEFKDKNGKSLKGLTSIRKFICSGEPCILAVTRDITDIKDEICK